MSDRIHCFMRVYTAKIIRAAGRGHFGRGQWPPVFNFLAGRDQIFGRGQILSLLLVGLPLNKVLPNSTNQPLIKPF
jgi:hypothetical protein